MYAQNYLASPNPTVGCPAKDPTEGEVERFIKDLKKPIMDIDAAIELYYTEAPLGGNATPFAKPKPGELKPYPITPNVNHSGVGFRVIQKNKEDMEFIFNMVAKDFGIYVLLPHLNNPPNSFDDLSWCNQALYTYISFIDRSYWLKSTYMCTVSRQDFYDLIDWLQGDYVKNNSTYIFLSIIKDISRKSIFNPIRRSCLCDDFCYDIFKYMQHEKNIAIKYTTVPDYSTVSLVIGDSKVTQIDMNDKNNQNMVLNFYKDVYALSADIFSLVSVLTDKNSTQEQKADAYNKLKNDLLAIIGPTAGQYLDEFTTDIFNIGQDIYGILNSIKIDPTNPAAKDVIKTWQDFISNKTLPNFYALLGALAVYLKSDPSIKPKIAKLQADYDILKSFLPKIISSFSQIIYYGYTDDNQMGYFIINGPVGMYLNYVETDMTRDRPFYNIYGKMMVDPYTVKNMDQRLISNYYCRYRYVANKIIILILLILTIIFLILWLRNRK